MKEKKLLINNKLELDLKSKGKKKEKKPIFYEDIGFFGRKWQRKAQKDKK